ncbi:uncharacterized protein LOC100680175 isoform X2 [Nasonia vitripennis]|uniref:Uncharacterized protein n=1 Tax=Nasonia vitripennis TaxID=7425 RepID=A0A7M7QX67_NASVI|nr:uncharacterized protein LOC100680175 isoform X2 [Nasonia vitripennis]
MMSSGAETSSENPADKAKQDALYEDREPKKIIRIITVTAYMVSVSFVGIVLSAYYIFLWHPPNPRLMHAQAISSHSEPRVDFHVAPELDAPTRGPPAMIMSRMAPAAIDVFAAADAEARLHPEQERLKTRREIVKNINPVLKANFEKGKSSAEATLGLQDVTMLAPVIAESSSSNSDASFSTNSSGDQTDRTRNSRTSSSLKNDASSEEVSGASSTRATKKVSSVKKQHQMPFALKHLEVPIKSEGSRKRPLKVRTTPTTRVIGSSSGLARCIPKFTSTGLKNVRLSKGLGLSRLN